VQAAIDTAKRLAEGGEFVRAISELEKALAAATSVEERDVLNALIRRYKRLASRQFFLNEAERLLKDKKYVEAWCNFERARDVTPIPLDQATVDRFKEAARKVSESPFATSGKVRVINIPGGTFEMGTGRGNADEAPLRKVTLSPCWLFESEVSNLLYRDAVEAEVVRAPRRLFAGSSVWTDEGLPKLYESHPVVGVTWDDAVKYCEWLTEKEHSEYALPKFMSYVLPTEAMWERAAGGPRTGMFPWSQGTPERNAVFGKWGLYGVESIRTRSPNEWNLYDMAGNAAEWCSDWYAPYDKTSLTDPTGPSEGEHRVLRGGSCLATEQGLRVTARFHLAPHYRMSFVGFRPAVRITDTAAWKKACGE
jgi:formylglycine-generating enzyme required for sulfatase activity